MRFKEEKKLKEKLKEKEFDKNVNEDDFYKHFGGYFDLNCLIRKYFYRDKFMDKYSAKIFENSNNITPIQDEPSIMRNSRQMMRENNNTIMNPRTKEIFSPQPIFLENELGDNRALKMDENDFIHSRMNNDGFDETKNHDLFKVNQIRKKGSNEHQIIRGYPENILDSDLKSYIKKFEWQKNLEQQIFEKNLKKENEGKIRKLEDMIEKLQQSKYDFNKQIPVDNLKNEKTKQNFSLNRNLIELDNEDIQTEVSQNQKTIRKDLKKNNFDSKKQLAPPHEIKHDGTLSGGKKSSDKLSSQNNGEFIININEKIKQNLGDPQILSHKNIRFETPSPVIFQYPGIEYNNHPISEEFNARNYMYMLQEFNKLRDEIRDNTMKFHDQVMKIRV